MRLVLYSGASGAGKPTTRAGPSRLPFCRIGNAEPRRSSTGNDMLHHYFSLRARLAPAPAGPGALLVGALALALVVGFALDLG